MTVRPLVIKFGGTSVGGGAQFSRAATITAGAARSRPVTVVVSAMSGTTDTLLGVAEDVAYATDGRTSYGATSEGSIAELHRTLSERHLAAARAAVAPQHLPAVEERLRALLKSLVETLAEPYENPAARRARVAVYGERLSAEILAGAVSTSGVPAAVVAEDPIATDDAFDEAEVDAAGTASRCSRLVAPLLESGSVVVVPGYVGRSPQGAPTTLGRGGSDLSATALGRALGSEEVWIMSDVDGVLDADPRLVPDANLMPRLSYREASLFASLGAKVLHPKTMEPAAEAGIEVLVRNTFNPECAGTRVTEQETGPGVRCVALRRRFAVGLPCAPGHEREAAALVGIGTPNQRDLKRGLKSLRRADLSPLHAGIATAGLVFVVGADAAETALRALHEDLVTPAATLAPESGVVA
ncbi:MAG TPA: aspartate kinase [Rubrobacteraceae bacterium]|nr:aspartate kinase [Rubrobacteraceae bacterium]